MVTRKFKERLAKNTQTLAKKVAVHYANVACPFLTYQPKMCAAVKKLRKF